MAEIYIRKKKSPVWLWVLGILAVLAVVIWFIITRNKNKSVQTTQTSNVLLVKHPVALKQKSITQVPGIVSLKLEAYIT